MFVRPGSVITFNVPPNCGVIVEVGATAVVVGLGADVVGDGEAGADVAGDGEAGTDVVGLDLVEQLINSSPLTMIMAKIMNNDFFKTAYLLRRLRNYFKLISVHL